ncbi:MAG TPA: cytochrome c oxidase subunit II [Polyangiales bacterium]|nr:cytochrome c oxidase subunit II [Polyangiales bacterium]
MDPGDSYLRKLLFLPEQASTIASSIDGLHYAVILVTLVGALLITLISIVFCIRYRMRRTRGAAERRPVAATPPLWAELTIVAGLFALFVAFWGVGYWQYVRLAEPPTDSYDIYVSGKQWMWKFAYPTGQHSAGTLYVPAGRAVRLIMTSRDVIHSFYVPAFRVKHDAVPGRYTSVWFTAKQPGTHDVYCAEYCGTDHSRMRAQVVVLSATDFAQWLQSDQGPEAIDVAVDAPRGMVGRGEVMAAKYGCLRCHTIDGSPHIGPTWKGLYGAQVPLEDGRSVVADVAYLTESMMDPLAKLHRGFAKVMPSYLGYMQPAEVGAIVEYIKSLRPSVEAPAAPLAQPERGLYAVPERPGQLPGRSRELTPSMGEPAGEIGQERAP